MSFLCNSLDQWCFRNLSRHITVMLLWKCWNKHGLCNQYGSHGPVSVYLAKGNQVILSICPLLGFFLQPLGQIAREFQTMYRWPPCCKNLLFYQRGERTTRFICPSTPILSEIDPGHQLAKSFLDQFVNSLSIKKDLGVRLLGSAAANFN